jgi:cysteine desulfurase
MERISNLIYFNNNRTTALDDLVKETMHEYQSQTLTTDSQLKKAKQQVGELINASPSEILFTSGTTESLNLSLKAAFHLNKQRGKHLITQVTEHFAVLNCLKELELEGAEVTVLGVDREGLIDPEALRLAIKPDTILVSLLAANNETGVIQPIERLAEICAEKDLLFISDASQFVGKVRCDAKDFGFSGLAFGAHKMYGPEGIGVLYLNEKHKNLMKHISQTYSSGLNASQIMGLGKAAELSEQTYWENSTHVSKLKTYLEHQLLDIEGLRINGSTRHRLYNTSNLTFPNPEKVIALQTQFDFANNLKKPSYVLKSMGLDDDENKNSFRFSFGKYNTLDEVKLLVESILK